MDKDTQQMDVYGGVRWSAIATYSVLAIRFLFSIVLARILLPEEFGLMAMAYVFIGFLQIFRTFGFGQAVVQRKEINDALLSSLFFVNLVIAIFAVIGTLGTAPVFGWIYGEPLVTSIMAALSVTFLLSSPAIVPGAILRRQMAFNRIAIVDVLNALISGVTTICFALSGWGVWSLVIGTIVESTVRTICLYIACRWRPKMLFCWSEVRRVFNFGANLTGFQVFNYFTRNADKFIIGAFLGANPLGYYSLAYRIMLFPRDAIKEVVGRAVFPVLCRMQDDDARLKAAYLRACGAIAFITFPMMIGLFVIAQPFVNVVLGEKWLPAVPLIHILALLGAVQSITSTVGQIFLAKGRADIQLRWGIAGGVLSIFSFLAGIPWGIVGVAISYSIMSLIWTIPTFWIVFRLVSDLKLRDLLKVLFPYAFASSVMGVLVIACRVLIESWHSNNFMILLLCVPFGIIVYSIIVLLMRPPALSDFVLLMPQVIRKYAVRITGC